MTTFIVSSRKITDDGLFEENSNGKQIASHDFRIAEYHSNTKAYELLNDFDGTDYVGVANSDEQLAGTAHLFSKLYKKNISKDSAGDILVFIHGFNYDLSDSLEHINQIEDKYVNNHKSIKHLVYVSWPSVGELLKYKLDKKNARTTGIVLARLLEKLKQFFHDSFEIDDAQSVEPCLKKIHLVTHSIGARVLYYMLNALDEDLTFPLFSEVLLLNADAPYYGFDNDKPFSLLETLAERTHVYIHKSDDALWISDKTKGNSKRLGRSGPRRSTTLNEETFIVDTTYVADEKNIKERFIDHWGYLNSESVAEDIRCVLDGMPEDEIPTRKTSNKNNWFTLKTIGKS